jgi:hypothetical protein
MNASRQILIKFAHAFNVAVAQLLQPPVVPPIHIAVDGGLVLAVLPPEAARRTAYITA